ncbi:MAG: 4-demethylwyosine synthase TYW1 [archaeon]
MISSERKKELEKQGYRIVGNHSAVKICTWTKKSLLDKDVCYKQTFYNIKSHQCCQMTPSLYCCNKCLICWRDTSQFNKNFLTEVDEPIDIINNSIIKQRELLNGFPGNENINQKKFKESLNPKYFAISLTGEPFIYPKIGSLLKELKKRNCCSFLVTNGMFPKSIENLSNLPTQLYVSIDAPNKELNKKIDNSSFKDHWSRLNKTLELLPSLNTRTCLRLTLVKGLNMQDELGYSKLIKKSKAKFVELKSFMAVGYSRYRLEYKDMPLHNEIKEFAEKICSLTDYKIVDEKINSRVVLLMKEDKNRRLDFN